MSEKSRAGLVSHSPNPPAVWDTHTLTYRDCNWREREVCLFLCVMDREIENDWGKWEKRET